MKKSMRFYALIISLFFLWQQRLSCQQFLQMDINKFGGKVSFMVGDELEFQLDGKKEWYKFSISGFDYEKQEILFDEMKIAVSRISKLYFVNKAVKITTLWLGSLLGTFGVTWTTYAVYGLIVASPMVGPLTFIVGAIALASAAILLTVKVFWKRKYKITKKRRLRIVDLTIYPNIANLFEDIKGCPRVAFFFEKSIWIQETKNPSDFVRWVLL